MCLVSCLRHAVRRVLCRTARPHAASMPPSFLLVGAEPNRMHLLHQHLRTAAATARHVPDHVCRCTRRARQPRHASRYAGTTPLRPSVRRSVQVWQSAAAAAGSNRVCVRCVCVRM